MLKNSTSIINICLGTFLTLNCYAADIDLLQKQCAEIGFKIKTPDNGKCVLRLLKSAEHKTIDYYEEPVHKSQAQRLEEMRQAASIREQQEELIELQKRSIVAQENIANEQRRTAGLQLMQKGLESMGRANRPAPTPILRMPIECRTYGNRTSCD